MNRKDFRQKTGMLFLENLVKEIKLTFHKTAPPAVQALRFLGPCSYVAKNKT